jgi:hypothetical protein
VNIIGGRAVFNSSMHLHALSVAGVASLSAGANMVLSVDSLSIPTGYFDLADNDLIVKSGAIGTWNGSAYTGVTGLVASGAVRSAAARDHYTALAAATASDVFGITGSQSATWRGQAVQPDDVLVKFTYGGDANLDGLVNIDDYGLIDSHVGFSGSVFGFHFGDFNYDGKINIDDYGIIDSVIGVQGPPII